VTATLPLYCPAALRPAAHRVGPGFESHAGIERLGLEDRAHPTKLPGGLQGCAVEYRACLSSYIILGIITGLPPVALVVVAFATKMPGPRWGLGLMFLPFVATLYWLSKFRLVIGPETVTYTALFAQKQTIRRHEITEAHFAKWVWVHESPFNSVLRPHGGEDVRINAKAFSAEAVQKLLALGPKESE
jgi:hypothetical protein